jgi:hypothetical protein
MYFIDFGPAFFKRPRTRAPDHAAFGPNGPNAGKVIEFHSVESAFRDKPVSTYFRGAPKNAD